MVELVRPKVLKQVLSLVRDQDAEDSRTEIFIIPISAPSETTWERHSALLPSLIQVISSLAYINVC